MRRMLAIVLCVLLASLSVCALSKYKIERFCERARHLRTQAIECMEAKDVQQAEVTLVKLAPMGDPMELRIHGYELTLRLDDAAQITGTNLSIDGGWTAE